LLARARTAGAVVSADLLSVVGPDALTRLAPVFAEVDHLLINDQQAAGLTGLDDPARAAEALYAGGPAQVVVSCGAAGGVLVDADGTWPFPALSIEAIDTTGCGDAFSAGYVFALSRGWPVRRACGLGTCCAALVAQRLGSDGISDLATVDALLRDQWDPIAPS
jgi:sugar/nucleoside kinase (ribokinase family)